MQMFNEQYYIIKTINKFWDILRYNLLWCFIVLNCHKHRIQYNIKDNNFYFIIVILLTVRQQSHNMYPQN